MKKILTVMLCLTLCVVGVCSCGNDKETKAETKAETEKVQTFSKTYTAEDADLTLAPDVILEPDAPPYNLGGWMFFNTVAFELNLPQEDTYTFTIEYSRPGEMGDALGSAYMAGDDEDDYKMAELTFKPTSKKEGDWSVYKTLKFTETLPEGQTILFIEPDELPEGCDHFINLRKITVTGTKPYDGGEADDENKKETRGKKEKGKHADFDGWWTLSPNYYENVIPIVSTFCVDAEEETWTVYDAMGEPGDTMSCSFPDKYTIILDMEGLGEQVMVLEGDTLFYTDDGHEAYVKVDEPQFVETGSYAGTWQFMGDPSHGIYYELTDSHAKKTGGDSEADTDYRVGAQGTGFSGGTLDTDIVYLDLPYPASPLYPTADGNALIEKDVFRNNVYIRDGAGLNPAYSVVLDQLVNTTFAADDGNEGESYHNMAFYPYSVFHIYKMIQDDEGYYTQDTSGDEVAGLWSLDANLNLVFTYEDGSQETFDLNNWDGTLNLGQTGQHFEPNGYFPF